MRVHWALLGITAASLAVSASAQPADQSMRQQIERLAATYAENFNKHDAAGIASLYTKDGMLVSSAPKIVKNGPQEIEQSYQNLFKWV
jgi:ketosteroid isomerase-like protein